jgi:hypothetical protein
MEFKPDWQEAKQRLAAWWRCEVIDRFAFHVTAPRDKPLGDIPAPTPPESLFDRWLDPDYRIRSAERRFATTWYGGEAFPYFDPYLGPGSFALYLGSEPVFSEDTVWYQACLGDLSQAESVRLDDHNRWWQATKLLAQEGIRRGKGRYLTSLPDLIENLDTAASLLGIRKLLHELPDRPQLVHRLQRRLLELYFRCFEQLYAIVADEGGGCCFSAFSVWAPGKMVKVQCDMSAMISPRMFEQFVVPYLSEQCERLDYSVYHLDGVDAIRHLDLLLSIPKLTALQWTPGANKPDPGSEEWFDIYRRARRAGKALLLLGVDKKDVQRLVEELGPEGLLISTPASSQREAEELLLAAETWTRKSRRA